MRRTEVGHSVKIEEGIPYTSVDVAFTTATTDDEAWWPRGVRILGPMYASNFTPSFRPRIPDSNYRELWLQDSIRL